MNKPCPNCHAPFLIEKSVSRRGRSCSAATKSAATKKRAKFVCIDPFLSAANSILAITFFMPLFTVPQACHLRDSLLSDPQILNTHLSESESQNLSR